MKIIAPDAEIHFTGAGYMSGRDYAAWMGETLTNFEGLEVTPMDCADNGDMLCIAWETSATIHGGRRTYRGVDRFRLKDGMAVEGHVIFAPPPVLTPGGRGGIEQRCPAISVRRLLRPQLSAPFPPMRGYWRLGCRMTASKKVLGDCERQQ